MTKETSNKITFLSFICIIMVVMIHSGNVPYTYQGSDVSQNWLLAHIVEIAISSGVARIAVPFFFVVSGYLFFYNVTDTDIFLWYHVKLKSRIFSLMIPYLMWSIIWIFVMLLIRHSHRYLGTNVGVVDIIQTITVKPINGQMWYIRDFDHINCRVSTYLHFDKILH